MRMHEMYDVAQDIKDSVIPHAIRYFTGEACDDPDEADEADEVFFAKLKFQIYYF